MHRLIILTVWLILAAGSSSLLAGNDLEFAPFAGHRFGGSFEFDSDYSRMDIDNSTDWGFTISQAASDSADRKSVV